MDVGVVLYHTGSFAANYSWTAKDTVFERDRDFYQSTSHGDFVKQFTR